MLPKRLPPVFVRGVKSESPPSADPCELVLRGRVGVWGIMDRDNGEGEGDRRRGLEKILPSGDILAAATKGKPCMSPIVEVVVAIVVVVVEVIC